MRAAALALVLLWSAVARADDQASAEAKFIEGKQLEADGKWDEACAAFDKSEELDPQFGTQYNLALCDEHVGKTASAWLLFRELAQLDTNAKRKKDSAKRAAKLEKLVMKVKLVGDGQPPAMKVTRDGVDVTKLVGVADPIDPGTYHVVASAPGYRDETFDLEVPEPDGAGKTLTVAIPLLQEAPKEPEQPEQHDEQEVPPPVVHRASGGHGRKIIGLAIGGGGVVFAAIGIGFGAAARSAWNDVKATCGADLNCEDRISYDHANAQLAAAKADGNLSTVLVGVGLAAIAAGVVVYVTAPHGGSVEVAPTTNGVVAWGTW